MAAQILDSLTSTRPSQTFKIEDEGGRLREMLLVGFPTAEDFVRQGRRAVVLEKVTGEAYQSIMDYETITTLITTRVPEKRR
jgi:hypothetical protein